MLQFYCIVEDEKPEVVFFGSNVECQIKVRELMVAEPMKWFNICKVVTVSTHRGNKSGAASMLGTPTRHTYSPVFPDRPSTLM